MIYCFTNEQFSQSTEWKTIKEAHWIKDSKHYSKTNLSIWWMLGLKAEGNSNKLVPKYQ